MKTYPRSLFSAAAVSAAMLLCTSGYAAGLPNQPADQASAQTEPFDPVWNEIRDPNRVSGRLTFFGQPTKDELAAFAAAGGRVVINARTVGEMDELDFN